MFLAVCANSPVVSGQTAITGLISLDEAIANAATMIEVHTSSCEWKTSLFYRDSPQSVFHAPPRTAWETKNLNELFPVEAL